MLRAVMVGCGQMSNGWLSAIRDTDALAERIEIVGFVDIDADVAAKRATEHQYANVSTGDDLAAMLEELKPDVVFDLVVPSARNSVVRQALLHGCDVLSEKPMANSLAEARDLLALARETGKVHAVVQNRRHLPGIRRIKALIDGGELGDITALHADFFLGPHFGGFREEMDHVLLLDMAIHTFDAARYILPSEPVAVFCQETNPKGSWYAHGASANALFDCADGSVLTYRGSWCAEGCGTSWNGDWRIIGDQGTLLYDHDQTAHGEVVSAGEGLIRPKVPMEIVTSEISPGNMHGGLREMLNFLRTGTKPQTECHDNIHSLAMVFAAIESSRTGKRVRV